MLSIQRESYLLSSATESPLDEVCLSTIERSLTFSRIPPLCTDSPEGNEFGTDQMPHRYHFLEPNHNKVDKDEYDFSRYNHSPFPGLDSTMPNSYANNLIQCLYFIPPVRSAIVSHLCSKEYCLVCELGFLFHMLDNAPAHTPCQASNFLRAFRTIPEVAAFKLFLPG